MKPQHRVVEIVPARFAGQVPRDTDSGEHIFDEGDVLKFVIDAMNAAKINISMINHAHEHAIDYQGSRDYFSMGLSSLDAPEGAVIDCIAELSYILNDRNGVDSWTSYKNGKHALHILRKSSTPMTDIETREAEDNIEASE